ncbi:sigma-70 family RNA polymerase sigma factor [Massilia terrae]|uniref:RNA polymerase sigma factor n=1 Tax=Massilia terrae TaxID=1811224 RepID=A0ABT2CYE9_9BURK|nr:sigma-70 family RNA polymerase sigma factor [Massilia terrae]MCS0658997.1 sigma-70 family RNA polymerase sigma factor [Massilia terrae]
MLNNSESDQLLVRLAQDGSGPAFDTLVLRYRRQLVRQVLPLVRDNSEAEDIVQDALVSAFSSLRNFRGDSSFFTWLYRIAINSAKYSRLRSSRRLPLISDIADQDDQERLVSEQFIELETPESILESQQLLHLLSVAIDELSADYRDALLLRELEGLSYEEIAERMHCPVGTVRSRVHRARESISSALRAIIEAPAAKH